MAWADERKEYEEAGFSQEEIQNEEIKVRREMSDSGFRSDEIDSYFGEKRPDLTALRQHFEEVAKKNAPAEAAPQLRAPAAGTDPTLIPGGVDQGEAPKPVAPEATPKKEAMGFIEAFEAGFGMSVTGLLKNGKMPDMILPEHSGMAMRIASQVGTLAGDLPAMVAGKYLGGWAGGAAGGAIAPGPGAAVGTVIGGGVGSMALPAAMRQILVDHYEKGDIKSFGDFWERASATFLESGKAGIVGAATVGAGGLAGKALSAASPVVQAGGTAMAEVATMTLVGKTLEGHVPEPQDFLDAAVLVGGLHAIGVVGPRIRNIYAKTGLKPEQVAEMASTDPVLKQQIAQSDALPERLKPLTDPASPPPPPVKSETVKLGDSEIEVKSDAISPKEPTQNVAQLSEPTDSNVKKVLDRIGSEKARKFSIDKDQFYTDYIDNLHPINVLKKVLAGEKNLPATEDPYLLARVSRGADNRAAVFIETAPYEFTTLKSAEGVKPLKEIIKPLGKDFEDFKAYAISKKALNMAERGLESGVPLDSAKEVVSAGEKKYAKKLKEIGDFRNSTLKFLKDSGILSQESYDSILKADPNAVPFYRVREEGSSPKSAGKGFIVRNPVKGLRGSERPLVDPIEAIVKETYLRVSLAERNRALNAMVKLAEENPEAAKDIFVKKAAPTKAIEVTDGEVAKFLKEKGLPEDAAESFDIFRPLAKSLGENEIQVFRDGKREVYEVTPSLAKAIKALDPPAFSTLMKILAIPAKGLRAGTVLSPEYAARNLLRDFVSASILGKGVFTPIDLFRGAKSNFLKDEYYQNWRKGGGASSGQQSIDRHYMMTQLMEIDPSTNILEKVWNVLKSPLEYAAATSELIENSTRVGAYIRSTKGKTDINSILTGAYDSREITLDFQRIGAKMQGVNLLTAFHNAKLQGLDKTVRSLKERPQETAVKIAAGIVLPTLYFYATQRDDPRWDNVPNYQKDNFWLIFTDKWEETNLVRRNAGAGGEYLKTENGRTYVNKGNIYRIPKGELGLAFGSTIERELDLLFKDNPRAFTDFRNTMISAFSPVPFPTFAVTPIEHWANKSTFTGGKIIPGSMESVLPEYQYTAYTSESAKLLAKVVGFVSAEQAEKPGSFASPAVIEHYVRGWGGQLGQYALKLADEALIRSGTLPDPIKPASKLDDIPVIKGFIVRYPNMQMQPIVDFLDVYDKHNVVMNTIQLQARRGDFDGMMKVWNLEANADKLYRLNGFKNAIGNLSHKIQLIYVNKDLTPDEKRQMIEDLYYKTNMVAVEGLKLSDEITKIMKGKK